MSNSFDLLTEPWIPALFADGSFRDVSILESFEKSSEILSVEGESALQTVAINRLLFAISYRALSGIYLAQDGKDKDVKMWHSLWRNSDGVDRLNEFVVSYLKKFANRFNLFDAKRPFFQIPDIDYMDEGAEKNAVNRERRALGRIMPDMDKINVFSNSAFAAELSYAQAARVLVTYQSFSTTTTLSPVTGMFNSDMFVARIYQGGFRGWSSSFGAFMLSGQNHRETLLLNFVPSLIRSLDIPFWEQRSHPRYTGNMFEQDESGKPFRVRKAPDVKGPVQLMTWFAKGVRLLTESERVVGVVFSDYNSLPTSIDFADARRFEVQAAWYTDSKGRIRAYAPNEHNGVYALEMAVPEPKSETQSPQNVKWVAKVANLTGEKITSRIKMIAPTFDDKAQTFRGEYVVSLPIGDMRLIGDASTRAKIHDIADAASSVISRLGSFIRVQATLREEREPTIFVANELERFRLEVEARLFALLKGASVKSNLSAELDEYRGAISKLAIAYAREIAQQAPVEDLVGRYVKVTDAKGVDSKRLISLASALSHLERSLDVPRQTRIEFPGVKSLSLALKMESEGRNVLNTFGSKTLPDIEEEDEHGIAHLVFTTWYDRKRSKGGESSHAPGKKLSGFAFDERGVLEKRFLSLLRSESSFEAKHAGRALLSYLSSKGEQVDYIDAARHIAGMSSMPDYRISFAQEIARSEHFSSY